MSLYNYKNFAAENIVNVLDFFSPNIVHYCFLLLALAVLGLHKEFNDDVKDVFTNSFEMMSKIFTNS